MLAIKPHTVTLKASTAVVLGDQLEGWEVGQAKTVRGQFTPLSARQAETQYGVQPEHPHLFLCVVDSVTNGIAEGWSLEIFGEKYSVVKVERYRDIGIADSCSVVVDRVKG